MYQPSPLVAPFRMTLVLSILVTVAVQAAEPPAKADAKPAPGKPMGPDVNALLAIRRPTSWTGAEVDGYVAEIIEVSSHTNHRFMNDPQVQMLAEVGPKNIEFLFEAMGKARGVADSHLEEAIQLIITDAHRELLRRYLPFHPQLASIVVAQGWQEYYREELIAGLNRNGYLSTEWFQAVAKLDDPRVSAGLSRYMETGNQMIGAYTALKARNDPKLDEAVAVAWRGISVNNVRRRDDFAPIAARHGEVDALVHIAHSIETPGAPYTRETHERAIRELVRHEGTPSELAAIVLANTDRLIFDPRRHQYTVP